MTTVEPDTLRLAAIVRASEDAIISHEIGGRIESWNEAAERLFGYTAAEAIGQPVDLIVAVDRRAADRRLIDRVRRGDTVRHFETIARTKGGGRLDVSMAVSALIAPDGEVLGVARIVRDISRQKVAERELGRLAAIVDSADDAIISKDLSGTVLTWNQAAERIFGYSAAEMIGNSIAQIIPGDRLAEEVDVLDRISRGERVEHFETIRRRKDGQPIEVSLTVSPIITPDGRVVGASKVARDVSGQRLLERDALRLAAIVDSSEDAIASKDLNGVVQTWNRAAERLFGYTADEIIGRPIMLIIPADREVEEVNVLRRIRAGQSVEPFDTVRRRKDGTPIEISLTVSPIRSRDGRVIGASKIARDVSQQRRLTREAEEANRVKDEFLATLSHELRTPLNAVLGYTRMLRSGQMSPDRRDRTIETIERNASVLSQLVADVLDVSAIVTGKVELKLGRCDLASLADAAVDVIRPAAGAKRLALVVLKPEAPIWIRCDADRLQQVFWNLLVNAVRFTPEGGRISVSARADDRQRAWLTVSDTGAGIAAEMLPRVFQRFWQGERGANSPTGGLGLGLALARHFAELHGGAITATSEGPGRGATFTVMLPLDTSPA